jgi:chromosomal replication initiation ATPase DnaA
MNYKISSELIEIQSICKQMGLSYSNIIENNRKRDFVNLRIAFAVRFRKSGLSLNNIGMLLKRDHATIIYYLKTFEGMEKTKTIPDTIRSIIYTELEQKKK